jgi:Raf kinase inhibitor-like YbhB/YbcL family protein
MALRLSSPDFAENALIPERFTCEGADVSPALDWADPPRGTKSFALIVDDPDAPDPAKPQRTWVHWMLYNLPAATTWLPQGIRGTDRLPAGARLGVNDWGHARYNGPCPPVGRHRYFLQALRARHRTARSEAAGESRTRARHGWPRARQCHADWHVREATLIMAPLSGRTEVRPYCHARAQARASRRVRVT